MLSRPNLIAIASAISLITIICLFIFWEQDLKIDTSSTLPVIRQRQNTFDVVLAHYQESPIDVRTTISLIKSVPAIAALRPRVFVYTKGSMAKTEAELEDMRLQMGADYARALPNRGREAETYLTHIIDHYDDLGTHVLFCQAQMEIPDRVENLLRTHFSSQVGAMSMYEYTTCPSDNCIPPIFGSPDPVHGFKRIPELFAIFNERFTPPEGLLLTFKGQFIVSRKRILRNAKHKFEWIRNVLNDSSHFVHNEVGEKNNMDTAATSKSMDNPIFGHTLERAWMVLFGCNDLTLPQQCNPGNWRDPNIKCACYDDDWN